MKKYIRRYFLKFLITLFSSYKHFKKYSIRYLKDIDLKNNDERLKRSILYAKNNIELYKKKYSNLKKNFEIKDVCVLTKDELKKAGVDILNDKYRKNTDDYILDLNSSFFKVLKKVFMDRKFLVKTFSGGTTGTPLTCYKNKNQLINIVFQTIRSWSFMGYDMGDKVLIFYNSHYEYGTYAINALSRLTGIKIFFFEKVSKIEALEFVKLLNNFNPDHIVSFPSYLADVTDIIEKENLRIKHFPKGIEVSGEKLFNQQRKKIEKVLRSKVYNSYGSMEFGTVAHECRFNNGLHIYEDIVKVENMNLDGNKNNIIISRIDPRDETILRYNIGDYGQVIYEKCRCGLKGHKLRNIEGRVDDYIILKNGQKIYASPFRQIIITCNEINSDAIKSSKFKQMKKDMVIVEIELFRSLKKKPVLDYLNKNLKEIFNGHMNFKIKFLDKLDNGRKYRFIERNI